VLIVHNPDVNSYAKLLKRAEEAGIHVIQVNMRSNYSSDVYVGADWIAIGEAETQALTQQFAMLSQAAKQGAVIAIVAPDDRLYATANIWEARLESEMWQSEVFRSTSDAKMWIREKLKQNFGVVRESLELRGTRLL